ncbi:MAG: hypothetical protein WD009_13280 [Phycisphaeraceae bacterium]
MDARPPILIHLHIPKNAGTTLSRMIKRRLLLRPPTNILHHSQTLGLYNVPDYRRRLDAINALPERGQRRIRFFEAHAAWGLHESLPGAARYVTMLREPTNRVLSVFSYRKELGRIPADMSLEAFVAREDVHRVWWVDNAHVRYLAGEHGHILDVPPGGCQRQHLELAKTRLVEGIGFFGLVERFDESLCLLFRWLNWKPTHYLTGNVTRRRLHMDELDEPTRDMIRELNVLDTELYAFACELFEQRVRDAGASFADEVAAYGQSNARANRLIRPLALPLFNAWHKLARRGPRRGVDRQAHQDAR